MGYTQATEFGSLVERNEVQLATAIRYHLGANHYPPIHPDFDQSAIDAILAVNGGDGDTEITLPNGRVLWAIDVVEQLHLEPFLDQDEGD